MIPNNNSFIFNSLSKIDHVHLRVSDLQKSIGFYQSILGYRVLKNDSGLKTAVLSTADDSDDKFPTPLLALTELQKKDSISHYSKIKKEAGLYRFAILLPERKFLASFLRHIQKTLIHNIMKVWQIIAYLNQYIFTTLILMELKFIEIDYLQNGYGMEIRYT